MTSKALSRAKSEKNCGVLVFGLGFGQTEEAQRLLRMRPLPRSSQSREMFSFVAIVKRKSVCGVVPLS